MSTYAWTNLGYGVNLGCPEDGICKFDDMGEVKGLNEKNGKGLDIVFHSLNESEPDNRVLMVEESIISPEGSAVEIGPTLPVTKPEWNDMLKKACKELKVPFKPQWILCCCMG